MKKLLLIAIASLLLFVSAKAQRPFYSDGAIITNITQGTDAVGPSVRNFGGGVAGLPAGYEGGTVVNFTSVVGTNTYLNQLVFDNHGTGSAGKLRFGHKNRESAQEWYSIWHDGNLNNFMQDFKAKNITTSGRITSSITRPGDQGSGSIDFTDNNFGYQYAAKFFTFKSPSDAYGMTQDFGSGTSAQLSLLAQYATGNIGFYTGSPAVERMRIDGNGNVGIGVATPLTPLEVRYDGYFPSGWGTRISASNATANKQVFLGVFNNGNTVVGAHNYALTEWRDIFLNTVNGTDGGNVIVAGNLGIGTSGPATRLDVRTIGALGSTAGSYMPITRLQGSTNNAMMVNDFWVRESAGSDWQTASYMRGMSVDNSFLNPTSLENWIALRSWIKQFPYQDRIDFGSSGVTTMTVLAGRVGINCTNPDKELTVKGTIHAREVLVDFNGSLVADFVFAPSYNLKPLAEVEAFVKENKHLPEIPSAAEVAEKGINLGEMQNKLLQKVEELTLYMIELQKFSLNQESTINMQAKSLQEQQMQIEALKMQFSEKTCNK